MLFLKVPCYSFTAVQPFLCVTHKPSRTCQLQAMGLERGKGKNTETYKETLLENLIQVEKVCYIFQIFCFLMDNTIKENVIISIWIHESHRKFRLKVNTLKKKSLNFPKCGSSQQMHTQLCQEHNWLRSCCVVAGEAAGSSTAGKVAGKLWFYLFILKTCSLVSPSNRVIF